MNKLHITSEETPGGLILRLTGAATLASADLMQAAVTRAIAARPAKVIVDLSNVTDISSLLAGQLVALQNGLKHHNGHAVLAAPIPRVREALERMRIGLVVPIVEAVT